jgi:hypothetical protein
VQAVALPSSLSGHFVRSVERGVLPGKTLTYDSHGFLLCFCTVALRTVTMLTLRAPTFLFLKEPDILTTIEGLLWQTACEKHKDLLWQAGLYKHLQNLPKKKYPVASRLAS